jgi:hypothetical protein
MKLFILLLLVPSLTEASGWYCDQVASAWVAEGKILATCGSGRGDDESKAKIKAFEDANEEFQKVCGKNTSCGSKMVNIDPQRSDCKSNDGKVHCKRLFYFHITEKSKRELETPPAVIQNITNHNYNQTIHQPIKVIKERVKIVDKDNAFKRFLRSDGHVQIYETNQRGHNGYYLINPSEYEIDSAIKRARSGTMNKIFILRE